MILSVIGNGNISKLSIILNRPEDEVRRELSEIARIVAESGAEIQVVPEGAQAFFAREYKKAGGRKVYGTIPRDDKIWGIDFFDFSVVDEERNCGDWFKQPYFIVTECDKILMLGLGQGTAGELSFVKYNFKFSNNPKEILIFAPFLREGRLPVEFSFDIEPIVSYACSLSELKEKLAESINF